MDTTIFDLSFAEAHRLLIQVQPEPNLEIPASLTLGVELAPWLKELIEPKLESASALERLIGLGMLARLWTPENAAEMLERRLSGELMPAQRVAQWARSLTDDLLGQIEADLYRSLMILADELDELTANPPEEEELATALARRALIQRDELGGALALLKLGKGSLELTEDLCRAVDERIDNLATFFARLPKLGDSLHLSAAVFADPANAVARAVERSRG